MSEQTHDMRPLSLHVQISRLPNRALVHSRCIVPVQGRVSNTKNWRMAWWYPMCIINHYHLLSMLSVQENEALQNGFALC